MKKKVILSMLSYLLITNLYANDNLSQEEKIQKISQFYKNRLNNIKDLKIKSSFFVIAFIIKKTGIEKPTKKMF